VPQAWHCRWYLLGILRTMHADSACLRRGGIEARCCLRSLQAKLPQGSCNFPFKLETGTLAVQSSRVQISTTPHSAARFVATVSVRSLLVKCQRCGTWGAWQEGTGALRNTMWCHTVICHYASGYSQERMNVAGALHGPKGSTTNSHRPYCVLKAAYVHPGQLP
jgi:hypothetical protein